MSTKRRVMLFASVILTPIILVAAILVAGNVMAVDASSHREAPLIAQDPYADNTDTFVWIPQGQSERIVLAASWIPFEMPEGGPNYYWWDEDATYYIHVDSNGDAEPDVTYRLTSRVETENGETFLYNTGPLTSVDDDDWNRPVYYTVTEMLADGTETVLVGNVLAPPVNIGNKSTPDWPSLLQDATYTADVDGDTVAIYAGQTDDPFFIDLQVFDLLTLRGHEPPIGYETGANEPIDSLSGLNVHSLVIEVPIGRLVGEQPVLGVWATTSRPSMRVLTAGGQEVSGEEVQISRLGSPLVNEVVVPLALKDAFNSLRPVNDFDVFQSSELLREAILDPEVGNLLCNLYGVPLPADDDDDCETEFSYEGGAPEDGRLDIVEIFLTGMVTAQPFTITTADGPMTLPAPFTVTRPGPDVRPAEMIRINTDIKGNLCAPEPSRLGLLAGDACGYPNGRRPIDDVTDISLIAVAGGAYELLVGDEEGFEFNPDLLTVLQDFVDSNDQMFLGQFPYLAYANSGQGHFHENPTREPTSLSFGSVTLDQNSAPWLQLAVAVVSLGLVGGFEVLRRRRSR
ncbi:MAG: DUF4331 domain-containing protein [Chloroflexota bacterium]|nr:DUF4331 domain-containing protein [Chloroflexota bacterium]